MRCTATSRFAPWHRHTRAATLPGNGALRTNAEGACAPARLGDHMLARSLIAALLLAVPAMAQDSAAPQDPPKRIRSVLLYGNQDCPPTTDPDEIVVCANIGDFALSHPQALPRPDQDRSRQHELGRGGWRWSRTSIARGCPTAARRSAAAANPAAPASSSSNGRRSGWKRKPRARRIRSRSSPERGGIGFTARTRHPPPARSPSRAAASSAPALASHSRCS